MQKYLKGAEEYLNKGKNLINYNILYQITKRKR
jgi:hypothetical protein